MYYCTVQCILGPFLSLSKRADSIGSLKARDGMHKYFQVIHNQTIMKSITNLHYQILSWIP